jgi:hypothetical protein
MKLLKKAVATAAASLLLLSATPVMAHGGHNNPLCRKSLGKDERKHES